MVVSPLLGDHLCLLQAVEDLAVEQFVTQARIEALDIAVLTGRPGFDERGLGSDRSNPLADSLRDELGSVVRTDVGRRATHDEQIRQNIDDIDRGELPADTDRQALAGVLVEHVQCSERTPVAGAMMDEVV